MFRLIGTATGLVLTIASIYAAQKSVGDELKEDEDLEHMTTVGRIVTSFGVAVIVGGTVSKILNSVFD